MKIVLPVFLLIAVITAITPADEDGGGDEATSEAVATEAKTATTAPPPAAAESGPTEEDLQDALDDAEPTEFGAVAADLNVKQIELLPAVVNITLETPEGGFSGASVEDLDGSAGAAFKAIYGDADWQKGATVEFTGGLVDTRTGEDLPDERTALYRLRAGEAQQIDWDNASPVDWSLYRLFVHPALQE